MIDEQRENRRKACHKALETIGIPMHSRYAPSCPYSGYVDVEDLYDILMDEEKLNALVSKLKLKAFW